MIPEILAEVQISYSSHVKAKDRMKVTGLSIAKVTCKLEDLVKYAYEYDGTEYVTFEVAKMKTPDNFGRDYTVYVSQKEEVEEPQSKKKDAAASRKPANKSKRVPAKGEKEDLPF